MIPITTLSKGDLVDIDGVGFVVLRVQKDRAILRLGESMADAKVKHDEALQAVEDDRADRQSRREARRAALASAPQRVDLEDPDTLASITGQTPEEATDMINERRRREGRPEIARPARPERAPRGFEGDPA